VATLMVTYAGSLEETLGFSTAELEGDLNRWVELVHPDDRAAFVREAKQACAGRAVFHLIYRVRKKDGSYLIVQDNGQAIRDAEGKVQRVIGFVMDITPQRALEEQYRQSQKMEAVGRLAGGIAHDFNNLLTVITGYGQLMQEQFPKGTPTGDIVQEITGAGNRAASLTRQLLAFSRKAILEPKVLDLRELVADMDRMLRRVIGEDIELVTAADPDLGMVKADPGHVQQVILNLAVNARDAMPRGGKLTVEVRNVELDEEYAQRHPDARPGPHVLLIVRDTGVGMDAATQARIWEPFFTTKGEKGTGLGLATVYGVVRQSGGHIAVESEPGQGATFKVYLPRAQENGPIGKSFHGLTSLTDLPRGTETILSVEDEEGVRVLTRHVLLSCGYQVLEASDGREALRVASLHPGRIHLLLTDVVMPQMGGREVAQRLSALYPGLKVMYLSGYTDDAVVRHGVQAGEVQLLLKPFSPTALAQKVRQLLDQN
jgi:PAS domain S-box-containing protein